MAGAWVMKQFFGAGTFILKKAIKGALGLGKFLVKAPFKIIKWLATGVSQGFKFAKYAGTGLFNIIPKFVRYAGTGLWNVLPKVVQRPLLAASALLGKMFTKAAIFTKSILRNMMGFAKWGASAAKVVAGWTWTAIMFGAGGVKTAAKWTTLKLLGYMGLTNLFSAAGAYLLGIGAAMIPALLGILIVGAGIGAVALAKMLIEAAYGKSIGDTFDLMDYAANNPEWAKEQGIFVPLGSGEQEEKPWWMAVGQALEGMFVFGPTPVFSAEQVQQFHGAGSSNSEIPDPNLDDGG
jgi:hypothetical protein